MKSSLCVFDVEGNVSMESKYVSVYRKGDMLVIVFLNLLFVPFMVKTIWPGRYALMIKDEDVLRVHKQREPITLIVDGIDNTGIRFELWIGSGNAIRCSVVAGYKISIGETLFLEVEVYEWAREHGVVDPVGCAVTTQNAILERGCELRWLGDDLVVGFPNGYRFILFRLKDRIRVVQTDVPCENPKSAMIVVSVSELSETNVRFRVVVWYYGDMTIFDDVIYDRSGVHYGDDYMSSRQITKRLVLGGFAT